MDSLIEDQANRGMVKLNLYDHGNNEQINVDILISMISLLHEPHRHFFQFAEQKIFMRLFYLHFMHCRSLFSFRRPPFLTFVGPFFHVGPRT